MTAATSPVFGGAPVNSGAFGRLIERVQCAPCRNWIDGYFDLLKTLVDVTGLQNADPRIVTSIPTSKKWFLAVSINHRYVLAPLQQRGSFQIGVIYGPEYEGIPELTERVRFQFSPLRDEHFIETPVFLVFDSPAAILEMVEVYDGWLAASLRETRRSSGSPYRKYHQPIVYEAAVEMALRRNVLNAAFPVEMTVGE